MSRPLTFLEKAGFLLRHPLDAMSVPYSSLGQGLIRDDTLKCVLMFPMADGSYNFYKVDDIYPNCDWNDGPAPIEAFIETLIKETGERAGDIWDKAFQLIIIVIVLLIVYFIASGKATTFIKQLT
jgi:hypothetical protein